LVDGINCCFTLQLYHKPVRSCSVLIKEKALKIKACGVSQTPNNQVRK